MKSSVMGRVIRIFKRSIYKKLLIRTACYHSLGVINFGLAKVITLSGFYSTELNC
jgi:hypothetical protein